MIIVKQPTQEEIDKETAEAYIRKKTLDRELDMTKAMPLFLRHVVGVLTQRYGVGIELKIAFDSEGHLRKAPRFYGDLFLFSSVLNKDVYFEVKSSYLSESNGGYRITHTRSYEKFNYFLLCLVDQMDNFQERFYLIPKKYITDNPEEFSISAMNGNNEVNKDNKNIEMSKTVSKDFAYSYFGKYSVLEGTDYNDWITFLNSLIVLKENQNMMVDMYKKFCFSVNGIMIEQNNNVDTILNLANHIGGITAMKIFPPNKIKHGVRDRNHTIPLNTGEFHINPNFTFDDVRVMLMRARKEKRLDLKLM